MRKLWLLLIVTLALTSCRTVKYIDRTVVDSTEIAVPITNTKIEYRDRFLYDSIYVHDSIFTLIKNDTVYIENIKYRYKYVSNIDTIVKNDTITNTTIQEVEVIKEVNKLKWWQTALMALGILSLVYIIIKIKK